jgi:transposase
MTSDTSPRPVSPLRARMIEDMTVREEQQANAIVFRARDLLLRQRTQCVNALRGQAGERTRAAS